MVTAKEITPNAKPATAPTVFQLPVWIPTSCKMAKTLKSASARQAKIKAARLEFSFRTDRFQQHHQTQHGDDNQNQIHYRLNGHPPSTGIGQ